ncbi:MAG TPA: carboxypeptidase regulatory-like domain-containing protein [Vicinamibacterales bacterium]
MSPSTRLSLLTVFGLLLGAAAAAGQGNPTGALSGHVVGQDSLALPGVLVTAASPVLQGVRTATTSANGDYIIPFLPSGDYAVTFDLQGFQSLKRSNISVTMAETQTVDIVLKIASIQETVTVTGTSGEIVQAATVASNFKKDALERLPVGRAVNDAVLLAPGVAGNGPSGNIMMSGALSFESQYLVNGVVVNENLRGQALSLFIEDAIQETKVSTGAISAEYGRFGGGVVNAITRSGGNTFSGSFRTTLNNDAWRSLTPFPEDQTVNKVTPVYEGTLGGPILRDRIWFFGAGRFTKPEQNRTLAVTGINYITTNDERRYEGKATYAINSANTVKAGYTKRTTATKNNRFGTIMDLASLYDNSTDQHLYTANYTSVLKGNFFVEGQYSKKISATMDTGSRFTDLVKGTHIADRSKLIGTDNPRFNSPTFCAVCGGGWLEHRDNWDWFVKGTYFLSTSRTGTHSLAVGFDNFKEWRKNDNWQSGSQYTISATSTIIDGANIYPVFRNDNTTFINWLPILQRSVGNDIRTYSSYVNDQWRFNGRLSFNLGARMDVNRSKDQSGTSVVRDSQWSPRVGMTWDIKDNGAWIANVGYARYVAGISTALVDAGSAGGRQASFSWFYQGPAVNTGTGPYLAADRALPILWDWFFANGGNDRATRTTPNIPGLSTKVRGDVTSPSSDEVSLGVATVRGHLEWRLDYLHRKSHDMYGDFLDASTGKVADPAGRLFDLTLVSNTHKARRTYDGLTADARYRWSRLQLGGNYTLSRTWGNFNGENVGSGPIRASIDTFPEYRQESWNYPSGYNPGDQRHKARIWGSYRAPVPAAIGRVDIGVIERIDSGVAVDVNGTIDPRPYVINPGYVTPTSSVSYYFIPRGQFRWDPTYATDLAVTWARKLGAAKGEVFFRGVVGNLTNNAAVIRGDIGINTRSNNTAFAAFNPFTTTPVLGTHWNYSPTFGQPQAPEDYQPSRQFSCSLGIRF